MENLKRSYSEIDTQQDSEIKQDNQQESEIKQEESDEIQDLCVNDIGLYYKGELTYIIPESRIRAAVSNVRRILSL